MKEKFRTLITNFLKFLNERPMQNKRALVRKMDVPGGQAQNEQNFVARAYDDPVLVAPGINGLMHLSVSYPSYTRRNDNLIITSKRRNNNIIIASCVR